MKGLYDVARHLVWLTQFGLSVVVPTTLCIAGSVWLRHRFTLGGWVVAVGVVVGVLAAVRCRRWTGRAAPPKKTAKKHLLYPLTDIRKGSPPLQKHRDVLQQASRLAVAVALCIAAMLAVYALTGHFTNAVLLGALIGFVMAMGNFLSLSITVSNAMNRAANGGSPQKAQLEIQTSSVVRPVILVIIYILLFRAELCDPLAAILPLLFAQVCIKLIDFFRPDSQAAQKTKDGDSTP